MYFVIVVCFLFVCVGLGGGYQGILEFCLSLVVMPSLLH